MARSRSFSRSAIRMAQPSAGSTAAVSGSSVDAGHTSSNASVISRENAATSFCNSRAAVLWSGVNRSKCGTSAAVSSRDTRVAVRHVQQKKKKALRSKKGHHANTPCAVASLPASFVSDLSKYSSSSTVPLRPEPTLRSILRFEREVRFVVRDAADAVGAAVYRVKAVKADASVITSTLCSATSSAS